jgi:hypothetical protein
MDFQVARGLKLITRFDALERKWMAARRTVPANNGYYATDNEAENIAFDLAYVQFTTPFGIFSVGNMADTAAWGPAFGDAVGLPGAKINWLLNKGPWYFGAYIKKSQDGYSINAGYPTGTPIGGGTDGDSDVYTVSLSHYGAPVFFGIAFSDIRSRTANSPTAYSYKYRIPVFTMWAQKKFGKIFVEDEIQLIPFGTNLKFNDPKAPFTPTDVKNDMGFSNFFNMNVDLAPAKVGFMFVYSKGDDPDTLDKKEGGFRTPLDSDRSFNPCLILWNETYMQWMGGGTRKPAQTGKIYGNAGAYGTSTYFDNVWFYQVYGDFNVTPKFNLAASFSYAYADKKPTSDGGKVNATGSNLFISDKYGSELDVTMKYKIYDNLEYMIGAAYLWTGDYFKGTNANVKLSNNYLITHKLTLTF